ncbi:hypothetical protein VP01_1999g1 [Puccinia sorghi]|uniref:Uncharacterized protein n=1 Tax=Puccinia sorghi TaxID=27349 RepID=A0A0L6VBD5_9BASI|nr:hypothetical protein VP01_1999g1 [Puccinia sorghi]
MTIVGFPRQHHPTDDDPFTSVPSTPSLSYNNRPPELSSTLASQSTPQSHQNLTTYEPSINSVASVPSPHLPGWYPSTPQPGSSVFDAKLSQRSSRSPSFMTCSLDDESS